MIVMKFKDLFKEILTKFKIYNSQGKTYILLILNTSKFSNTILYNNWRNLITAIYVIFCC